HGLVLVLEQHVIEVEDQDFVAFQHADFDGVLADGGVAELLGVGAFNLVTGNIGATDHVPSPGQRPATSWRGPMSRSDVRVLYWEGRHARCHTRWDSTENEPRNGRVLMNAPWKDSRWRRPRGLPRNGKRRCHGFCFHRSSSLGGSN